MSQLINRRNALRTGLLASGGLAVVSQLGKAASRNTRHNEDHIYGMLTVSLDCFGMATLVTRGQRVSSKLSSGRATSDHPIRAASHHTSPLASAAQGSVSSQESKMLRTTPKSTWCLVIPIPNNEPTET